MANLEIYNASAHNLKGIVVTIPHQRFTCVCGVSGSGKSSLVYDIIERESKKRFFESFSAYARQKIGKMGRARAERITGLLPVISLRQHISASGSRSTAGTMCGVDELLRLLFARFGVSDDTALLLTRSLFSRNTPQGMCTQCRGLGREEYIDEQRIIDDETRSLRERALRVTLKDGYTVYSQVTLANLDIVCRHHGFTVDTPLRELTTDQRRVLFYGSDAVEITYGKHTLKSRLKWQGMVAKPPEKGFYKGIIPVMSEILKRDRNPNILRFCSSRSCSACEGSGLNEAARSVIFEGRPITWYSDRTFEELDAFMASYATENRALAKVVRSLGEKTRWLCRLGLGYISASRRAPTLSGGEAQRVRLVGALGIGLKNIMYLLDEPTAGLHLKESTQMIRLFYELTAQGNTVVVVEHDRNTILSSDHLIEIGPGAGYMGGEVVYQGPTAGWVESAYKRELCGEVSRPHVAETTSGGEEALCRLSGITFRNLKSIDVSLKLSALNVVCGVSGSGKSSLVMHELPRRCLHDTHKAPGVGFTRIIEVTNAPMGRTSRSNPATYTGVFNEIRKRFAATPLARERGYKATHFSFNTSKGSCDECKGHGRLELGLHFMENYTVVCPSCGGQRFKEEVLEVTLMGKNIAQVLELEVDEALTFFVADAKISEWLQILADLGLGYVKLGQSSATLSGGEAQRLRLASELGKKTGRESLILLDEPSRGLSAHETELLLVNLRRLAAKGATIVYIEHDPQLIRAAERVIELGPGSGDKGGQVIFQGSPEAFEGCTDSPTVRAMREPVTLADVSSVSTDTIGLYGVTTNSLKSIDIEIPQCALTVVSGGSGSGKRSLAVQTLYAESWQRYASSLSGYVRRFVGNKTHADVRHISNLLPAILISGSGSNRRRDGHRDLRLPAAALRPLRHLLLSPVWRDCLCVWHRASAHTERLPLLLQPQPGRLRDLRRAGTHPRDRRGKARGRPRPHPVWRSHQRHEARRLLRRPQRPVHGNAGCCCPHIRGGHHTAVA